jgi:hypothetical protein
VGLGDLEFFRRHADALFPERPGAPEVAPGDAGAPGPAGSAAAGRLRLRGLAQSRAQPARPRRPAHPAAPPPPPPHPPPPTPHPTHTPAGWKPLLQRELPGRLTFSAWSRPLPCGGTEYLSRTLQAGASAREVLDFYLDDGYRPRWAWAGA